MSHHAEHEAGTKRDWPIEVTLIAKLAKTSQLFYDYELDDLQGLCV